MGEPDRIIVQTKEDYDAEQKANYREGATFSEILALLIIFAGFGLLFTGGFVFGLILLVLGILWIKKLYNKSRKRILDTRGSGERELYRIRNRGHHGRR